jgi:hypothetical protein
VLTSELRLNLPFLRPILPTILHLPNHGPSNLEGTHARRRPRIHHRMANRLADLLLAQPIPDRTADVHPELSLAVLRHQDPDVEERSLLAREAPARPTTPADLDHVILDGLGEGGGPGGQGGGDIGVAEDLAADFETPLVVRGFLGWV